MAIAPGETAPLIEHTRYASPGRPTSTTPLKATAWQMHAHVRPENEQRRHRLQHHACFVLGTNMAASPVSDPEIMVAYKAQAQAEGSFRFRKDPLGFVSSLFVQKPSRIQGMLLVMTLALLVYAGTQRRLRQQWARQGEPVPRKSNQPTAWPPLRGGCQLREGMHRVRVTVQGQRHDLIEGLNRYRAKSSACVGKRSVGFIKFLLGRGCSMSVHTVLHVACRRVVVPAWMV